jgi:hypothetical protein
VASLVAALVAILKAILTFPLALWALLRLLCRLLHRLIRPESKRPGRVDKAAKTRCVPIRDPAMVTPDPLVYSQYDLMAKGIAVTWDNPDFGIFKGGVKVDSHQLEKDTDYVVVVRVWNASTDCPVVNMPVHLSYLDFGIGTTPQPVASKLVDVGVIGAPDNPSYAQFTWHTPPVDGHYCLQAQLDPASDLNYGNNLGQHNTDVVEAHSPAVFTFPLRNNTDLRREYHFETDAYVIKPRDCIGQRGEAEHQEDIPQRRSHPVPAGWDVDVSPEKVELGPATQAIITATITPPAGFTGKQVINIHAYYAENHTERAAGGVSVTVTKA